MSQQYYVSNATNELKKLLSVHPNITSSMR